MRTTRTILLTVVLLWAAVSLASTVSDVIVEGHESASTRDIVAAFGVAAGDTLAAEILSAGADSVAALLAGRGRPFASVRVTWDEAGDSVVRVLIDEGPSGRVASVSMAGNASLASEDLASLLATRPGVHVSAALLAADARAIAGRYADAGRPLVSVVPRVELGADPLDGLVVMFEITEGREVSFGRVAIVGNERTREHVIVRETGLERGALFRASALSAARPALERLPYLARVEEPIVAVNRGTGAADVGIVVAEARASRLSGVLGYAPAGDGDGEVTGSVDIHLGNIAGTGRAAEASWERVRTGHDRIAFAYTEPWVLGAPIDIGVRAEQVNRDTLYATTEGDLSVTARFGPRLRATWSVGGERYVPGGDAPSTDGYRTALALTYDRTDRPLNPMRGFETAGRIRYTSVDATDGDDSYRIGALEVAASAYVPVRAGHIVALSCRAAALASSEEDVPLHQQLVLGGAGSLRGYREDQFHGTRTAVASVEYRVLLGRYSRFAAFIDAGHYAREGSNPTEDTKLGYGVGLRGETRLGIIAVDYGLGEGDGFLDGKLHAALTREF